MDLVAISDNSRQKSFYDKSISVSIMWDADEKNGIREISIFIVIAPAFLLFLSER